MSSLWNPRAQRERLYSPSLEGPALCTAEGLALWWLFPSIPGECGQWSVLSARGQSLDKKGLKVCQRAGPTADGWSLRGSGLKSSPGMIQRETHWKKSLRIRGMPKKLFLLCAFSILAELASCAFFS